METSRRSFADEGPYTVDDTLRDSKEVGSCRSPALLVQVKTEFMGIPVCLHSRTSYMTTRELCWSSMSAQAVVNPLSLEICTLLTCPEDHVNSSLEYI